MQPHAAQHGPHAALRGQGQAALPAGPQRGHQPQRHRHRRLLGRLRAQQLHGRPHQPLPAGTGHLSPCHRHPAPRARPAASSCSLPARSGTAPPMAPPGTKGHRAPLSPCAPRPSRSALSPRGPPQAARGASSAQDSPGTARAQPALGRARSLLPLGLLLQDAQEVPEPGQAQPRLGAAALDHVQHGGGPAALPRPLGAAQRCRRDGGSGQRRHLRQLPGPQPTGLHPRAPPPHGHPRLLGAFPWAPPGAGHYPGSAPPTPPAGTALPSPRAP